ncbi:MAG TPA: hypothetical protein DCY20_06105 [Firmicutes bacterium]|nr:hypothetical protein [Bacillota bacterium]
MTKRSAVSFVFLFSFLLAILLTGQHKIETLAVDQVSSLTQVSGVVKDDNGFPIVSRLRVLTMEGESVNSFYSDLHGHFEAELEKGNYIVEITKGYEYERVTLKVEVKDNLMIDLKTVTLAKKYDWEMRGYISGDLHQHSFYSKDGKNSVNDVFLANVGSGLRFGVLSDHNSTKGLKEWLETSSYDLSNGNNFIPIGGVELSSKKGHFQAIDVLEYAKVDHVTDEETLKAYLESISLLTPCLQVNHPLIKGKLGFTTWDAISFFQTIEIWNGHALPPIHDYDGVPQRYTYNVASKKKWFELLNQGLKVAATGSSDNHNIQGSYHLKEESENPITSQWANNGLYTGQPSTFVKVNQMDKDSIVTSLNKGASFITNGPLLDVTIGGSSFGDTISFNNESDMNYVVASNTSNLKELRVIADGVVVQCIQLESPDYVEGTLKLNVASYHWLVFEVITNDLGYAISNPIYIK